MAFRAKYFSDEYLSKQIATLGKASESVSTNLSLIAPFGNCADPLLPDRAASTVTERAARRTDRGGPRQARAGARCRLAATSFADHAGKHALGHSRSTAPAAAPPPRCRARAAASARRPDRRKPKPQARRRRSRPARPTAATSARRPPTRPRAARPCRRPTPSQRRQGRAAASPTRGPMPRSSPRSATACKRLAPLGAEIEIAAPVKQEQCGSPAPVLLKRIGSGATRVEFQPPPMLNCAMVASLHTWIEKTLQPAAQEVLGSPIVRVRNASGYACRNRVGSAFHSDRLSEHALANAIDIMGFVTADGRTIDVEGHWGPNVRDLRKMQEHAGRGSCTGQEGRGRGQGRRAQSRPRSRRRGSRRQVGQRPQAGAGQGGGRPQEGGGRSRTRGRRAQGSRAGQALAADGRVAEARSQASIQRRPRPRR